jgi:hypothetical protein
VGEFAWLPIAAIGSRGVPYYRVYLIGRDGHFIEAINLDCANDAAAIESAKQLINGHDVEVWQQDRLVTKLAVSDPE